MSQTYVSELIHCVFSTKLRRNLITAGDSIRSLVFSRRDRAQKRMLGLMVGGTDNHVHILLSLRADLSLARAMPLIKGASSRWMNETHT